MASKKKTLGQVLIYTILSLWALLAIYPFFWVIINSFKVNKYIRANTFAIPTGEMFTLDNYIEAFERVNIFAAYRTSLVISISVTVAVVIIAGLAAYGMARYDFRGRKFLQSMIIASMMFPVFSTIIPVFRMMYGWGIVQFDNLSLSMLCVILPQIAGNLSFAMVVLMGFIRGIPIELEEAAYLEGYSVFQIFWKIVFPLARPSFATVSIFTFLWSYNDLFTQKFFLRNSMTYSVTRLLEEISSQAGTNYGLMVSSVVLVVVPVLVVYVLLQKNIIKGMTVGAMKG
ncbi:MAG: carbohydrate ABC transporter permease [Faecalibacterium sp.]